jgi:hypothetical protein
MPTPTPNEPAPKVQPPSIRPKARFEPPWWVAFGLSLFALVVSVWSSFSPANVKVDVSAPVWISRDNALGVKLACVFSNTGARTGIVSDLVLQIDGEDRAAHFLFFPVTVIDETQFTLEAKPDIKWAKGIFYPVAVQGKQSLVLSFIFIAYHNTNFTAEKIVPQKYTVTVLTRLNTSTNYDKQQIFTVNLDRRVLETLQRGTMVEASSDLDSPRDLIK